MLLCLTRATIKRVIADQATSTIARGYPAFNDQLDSKTPFFTSSCHSFIFVSRIFFFARLIDIYILKACLSPPYNNAKV